MDELSLGNKIKQELRKGVFEVKVPVHVFTQMWFGNQDVFDYDLTTKILDFSDKFGLDYTITLGNNPTYNFWRSFEKRRPMLMEIRKI
jgi:hypothetical protein